MYEWRISAKYIVIHIVLTGILLLWALTSITCIGTRAKKFADELDVSLKIEGVNLEVEYARYAKYFLYPNKTGFSVVKFYNDDMTNAIDTKEECIKYIELNYFISHFLNIGMVLTAISFFAYIFLLILCAIQRQNCIFALLGITGSLLCFLVNMGVAPICLFIGTALLIFSIILVIFYNYHKLKKDNYKIANRREIYN